MSQEEKFIPEKPRLRYIEKTLSLLESDIGPDGQKINWKDLYEEVGHWDSGIELSDKIREVVREYLLSKFPRVKEKIPSIDNLPDPQLLNAISNGWFEELGEEVGDTRREVLLAVLAHITKRIETRIYKKILEETGEDNLQKLGLSSNTQKLVMDCLDASVKSNPLFIRFLAYSQLAPEPPKNASSVSPIGQDEKPHTFSELFPHETQFISKKLAAILSNSEVWDNEPGADDFKEYLKYLADFFDEKNTEKAKELHKKVEETYGRLVTSDFPIIIVPPLEGYYQPPYLDPELRVALRTPESKLQESNFRSIQTVLADKLGSIGVEQFSDDMRRRVIRSYISIGSYGVGITFNAVAQEEPALALYLNEQIRAYDKDLKTFLPLVDVSEKAFSTTSEEVIEEMSRNETIFHELSHAVYPTKTPEAKRLGPKQESVIAEVAAESIYRGLAKELIDENKIEYTEDQYISVTLCMPLQVIEKSDADNEYYKAAVFVLNGLFEGGIAEFDGFKIHIKDNTALFRYFKNNAEEIISLYKDTSMTEQKAKKWLSQKCKAGPKLQELIDYIKTRKTITN